MRQPLVSLHEVAQLLYHGRVGFFNFLGFLFILAGRLLDDLDVGQVEAHESSIGHDILFDELLDLLRPHARPADVHLGHVRIVSGELNKIIEANVAELSVHKGQSLQETLLEEYLKQLLCVSARQLTVLNAQRFQMVRDLLMQDRLDSFDGRLLHDVVSVCDLLEVFELLQAVQDLGELLVIDTAIVEDDAIDSAFLEVLARFRQSLRMTDAERVTFEAQSLQLHIVQHGQHGFF